MGSTTAEGTGKGKKAGGRKNAIAGFYVEKIDGARVRAYVKEHGLELGTTTKSTVEEVAVALALHFRKEVPEAAQVRCDNCQAISSEEEEVCPFCGDEGEAEDGGADAPPSEESAPALAAEVVVEEPEEPAPEKGAEKEAKMGKAEGHVNGAAKKGPSVAKAAAAKEEKKGKEAVAALAPPAEGGRSLSAKDLDRSVARIHELAKDAAANYWALGREIAIVNEGKLWKLRVDAEGKPLYKSFEAWVVRELQMSAPHAYSAIDCTRKYTAEQIRELGGSSKAALMLKVSEEDRPALEEKAKAGAPVRELAAAVSESRKKHGSPKKNKPQSKAGKKAAETKATTKSAERITVANIVGSRTIKLYKKPENLRGVEWPPEKRARTVGDKPFGRLELQPGVVQYYSVLSKDGELVLNVQTVREE